jgi:hypothetical protein
MNLLEYLAVNLHLGYLTVTAKINNRYLMDPLF